MFNYNYFAAISICFFLLIDSISSTPACASGQVKCSTGTCDSPAYIEGCLTYKSKTECDVCDYNYAKKNELCQFQPNSVNKACQQFDFNGQCKKCAPGLYLNPSDKECVDIKLPGCLEKNADSCVNCAKNFKLLNGACIPRIKGCLDYSKSGVEYICVKCEQGFDLFKGECASSQWKNYQQKECIFPFRLNKEKGVCQIPNCKSHFELGCVECGQGFDLNKNGDCIQKKIPGCIDYASETECKLCEDSLYLLFKGVCYPYGCLQMNQNYQCVTCNSKLGFVLQQGQCVIPNCYYHGKNGCNICQEGRIWYKNQCFLESQIDSTVCVTCPATHFLNSNNECQKKDEGCIQYKQNICASCDPSYVLDNVSRKCIKRSPGCIYNDKAQCVSCQSQYVYNQVEQKCFIIGCGKYAENGRCAECTLFFKLNVEGFCSIENCVEIQQKGCSKCVQNYQVNKDGLCVPYDPHCIARNIYEKCIGCHEGFYVDSSARCRPSVLGCNYIDGVCTSCKTPFVYQRETATCFIDGCKQYFFGGCETCYQPYELRYNSCKLPHCLVSSNGRCLECDPDYIMRVKTNQCINKDEFCYEYNKDGECVECAPKYFMSKLQQKCLAREPGCLYDDQDKCSKCFAPFKPLPNQNKCHITGCLQHNLDNCKQCKYPFELTDDKQCAIKNCLKNDDEKCVDCFGGYLLENGLCTTGDSNCVEYNFKSGECLKCKQGYKVVGNKCQYEDAHCQSFTSKGNCQNCQRLYFLNPLKQCQLKDANCQQYVNGYCTKCKPYYYYFDSLCYQNTKGCAVQLSIDKCQKCEEGYRLDNGKCLQNITKLNWNSIDMDFFASNDSKTKETLQQTFSAGKQNKINLEPCLRSGYGRLFYSSDVQNTKSVHIEADGNGWQPKSQLNEYIGVQVPKKEFFYAIDVKCLSNNKMTSFTLEYLDVNTSTIFKKGNSYDLVCEAAGVVKTIYFTPVEAYAIRIKTRKGLPNIKVEFYYNNQQYKPVEVLKNDTIIKQTIQSTIEAAHQLLSNDCKDRELCWFGLEICEPRNVTGFVIQNDAEAKGAVTSVFVDYSVDGIRFTCYNECQAINVVDGVVKFNKTVFGTKVRVHISGYQGEPDIRVKFDYN